ncbi:hypothetical protein MSAN_01112400 [Mycena sanguinolenta]|uniref:Uncharacterized protein n=1 Tax=Mycena sanguinolenta TaxID=230812 RepID=A0A8H6YM97_9AGAR|nr:hypothetical protein MSAN_01112400 [Mycena sanguinolenta]
MAQSSITPGTVLDLTRNRRENVPLGPFDSRVSAILRQDSESYFVSTNASYVPALPIRPNQTIFLREDMRYGEDDPTLWPQKYSAFFCHLGAIQRKPVGTFREISIMWWDPTTADFVLPDAGFTMTTSLGKLNGSRIAQLAAPIARLLDKYHNARPALTRVQDLLDPMVQQIHLGFDRLQTLPCTFTQLVVSVAALQRSFLEADALIRYMLEFKPRMVQASTDTPPRVEHCVGVFTIDPAIAQQFRAAGLPYWLLRPTWTFTMENILEVVEPQRPEHRLKLEAAPAATHHPTKRDTDSKIAIIHQCSRVVPWYSDPFADNEGSVISAATASPSTSCNVHQPSELHRSGQGGSSRQRSSQRFEPYSSAPRGSTSARSHRAGSSRGNPSRSGSIPGPNGGRDKFAPLARDEMPPSISVWENALKAVDRTVAPRSSRGNGGYVFPEPALVVSSEDVARRQHQLYNLGMMMDALVYRLGSPDAAPQLLSVQQWRDILVGNAAVPQMVRHDDRSQTRVSERGVLLNKLLAPAFRACGMTDRPDLSPPSGTSALVTRHRAQEMLWQVGEISFRFEFLALDRRASGLNRPDQCRECFAGSLLMGMPLGLAKEGLASMSPATRHPFYLRIARLMHDWNPRPRLAVIAKASEAREWDKFEMSELEEAVAGHYTQAFYEHFGCAAVIPARLVHEFGT